LPLRPCSRLQSFSSASELKGYNANLTENEDDNEEEILEDLRVDGALLRLKGIYLFVYHLKSELIF